MTSVFRQLMFRLKKSKLFWILFGIAGAVPVLVVLCLVGVDGLISMVSNVPNGSLFEAIREMFPQATQYMLSQYASYSAVSMVLAMVCSSIVLSKEFSYGTMRNVILANKSRSAMFFAYYLVALLIGGSYFMIDFSLSVLLYGSVVGIGLTGGAAFTAIISYFAMGVCGVLFTQTAVIMFLFSTRKMALTIILPFVVTQILPSLADVFVGLMSLAAVLNGHEISQTLLQCLPFINLVTLSVPPEGLTVGMIVLYDILFSGGFFCIGYFPFQKADLK